MQYPRALPLRCGLFLAAQGLAIHVAIAQVAPPTAPPTTAPAAEGAAQPNAAARRGPRPYAQVITARAVTDRGGIPVHRVDDRFYFEIPDSLLARDFLMVTRVAGVPAGSGGFQSAGSSLNERLIRWERSNDRILLKSISTDAVADDTLPIAKECRAKQLSRHHRCVSDCGVSAETATPTSSMSPTSSQTDNPATSGMNAESATHAWCSAIRCGAELHQQHARISHQHRSASGADV